MTRRKEGMQSFRKGTCIALLALVVATLGVYGVSLFNGFVLDDDVIIVKNPLTQGLSNIRTVLFSPDVIKPYYRPLNRATYLFDYWAFGMNPMGFHAVNIFIHLLNVLLLYMMSRRVLQNDGAAFVAALLFAVHPVNTEAVNFVSARNTLLSLLFSLASFLAFMRAQARGARWPLLSALLFLFGLLSKETSFMVIGLIALYTVFPLPGAVSEKPRVSLSSLIPYVVAVAVYSAMRIYSLHGMMGVGVPDEGLFIRLARNYHIIPQYLALLVFPRDLTVCHSLPQGGLFTTAWFFPVWVGLVAGIAMVFRSGNKAALFGLAWVAFNYFPIANIVPIPSETMTERFLYLPAVGGFVLAGAGFNRLHAYVSARRVTLLAVAILSIVLGASTLGRNLDWKDEYLLFSSAVRNNPSSSPAHYNLGTVLRERGDLVAARREWEIALKLEPRNSDALIQMGTLEAIQGNLKKAEEYYTAALNSPGGRADPERSMAHYNLGKIYEKEEKPMLALRHYEQFLRLAGLHYAEYIPDARERVARLRAGMAFPPSEK
jgi:protein O-mannosyl-transferase